MRHLAKMNINVAPPRPNGAVPVFLTSFSRNPERANGREFDFATISCDVAQDRSKDRKGSVLILTLIVVTFLSALALQLGHIIRSKNTLVRVYQNDIVALHIAQGAVHKVISEIERDKTENGFDYPDEGWIKKFMRNKNVPKVIEWRDAGDRVVGRYAVRITDESGKININTAEQASLESLLGAFKGIDSAELARDILHYRDNKDMNKAFYSVHELLSLKGMDKDVFLGEDANENGYADTFEEEKGFVPEVGHYDQSLEPGLKDHVTVFTNGRINLNTASLTVLLSMPGINEEIADALIKRREEQPFAVLDEVKEIPSVSGTAFTQIVQWASVQSDWYKVVASAQGSGRNKVIVAYIDRSGDRSKIKYWREN